MNTGKLTPKQHTSKIKCTNPYLVQTALHHARQFGYHPHADRG